MPSLGGLADKSESTIDLSDSILPLSGVCHWPTVNLQNKPHVLLILF